MASSSASSPADYVRNLDLPETGPRLEGVERRPVEFRDARQAVVVGAQLTEFTENVSPDLRLAVADSILLAQLGANKAASKSKDLMRWYRKYTEILQTIGWQLQDLEFQAQEVSDKSADVHRAILPVITAMLGPAAAAASMVVSVLEGLQQMDANSPWITLFDQTSQHASGAKFQVSYVDANDRGDMEITLVCFGIEARRTITQVLFFKISSQSAKLKKAMGTLSVNTARLTSLQDVIAQRVLPFLSDNIKSIAI